MAVDPAIRQDPKETEKTKSRIINSGLCEQPLARSFPLIRPQGRPTDATLVTIDGVFECDSIFDYYPNCKMADTKTGFLKPNAGERIFNRLFGCLVCLGIGLRHNYVLEVRGRKSGRIYRTPVNLLKEGDHRYLVCGRGRSQWVRNAEASSRVVLRKGLAGAEYRLTPVLEDAKPALLKLYLDRFKLTVQRYFPVRAGSPAAEFVPYAARYPVFELQPLQAER
jgi:hypothetical protein